ncbi:hypothetical protein MKW94_005389 [Papaver nudicaule]|uniref:Retrotransposon gag domain-containing protein n=1 Tax=Papaver nudicaule TaxID=74823 RepID=A0AA42AXT2_PAPNU|nr:hypothetical protein [Papaver nudicaule]
MDTILDTTLDTDGHLVKEFKLLDPPVFTGSSDIAVAEEWFRLIGKKLGLMRVTDEERLILATSMLKGEASHWWDINRHTMVVEGMTWREFEDSFLERYYPFSDRNLKKIELVRLAHIGNSVEKRLASYPSYAAEMEDLESKEIADQRTCDSLREQEQKVLHGAPKEIGVEGFSVRMKNEDQDRINSANPNSELIPMHDLQPHPFSQQRLVLESQEAQHILQNQEHQLREEVQQQQRKKNGPSKKDRQRLQRRRARMKVVTVMNEAQKQQPKIAVVKVASTMKETQQPEVPFVEVTTAVKVTEQQKPDVALVEVTNEMKETAQSELGLVEFTTVMKETQQLEVAPVEILIEEQQKQLHQVLWLQAQQHPQQRNQMQQLAVVESNIEKQKHQPQQLPEQQRQQPEPVREQQPVQNFKSTEIGEVRMLSPLWELEQQVVPNGAPTKIKGENFSSGKQNGGLDTINSSNSYSEPNLMLEKVIQCGAPKVIELEARMKNEDQDRINFANPNSELIPMHDLQPHPFSQQRLVVESQEAQHILQNQEHQLREEVQQQQRKKCGPSKKDRQRLQRRRARMKVVTVMNEAQNQQPEIAVVKVATAMKETQQQKPEVPFVEVTTAVKVTEQQEPEVALMDATKQMRETAQSELGLVELTTVMKEIHPWAAPVEIRIKEQQKQLKQVLWQHAQQHLQLPNQQQQQQQQQLAFVESHIEKQKHQPQQLLEQQRQPPQPVLVQQPVQNFRSTEIGEVRMLSQPWDPEQQAVPNGAPEEIKIENFSSGKQNGALYSQEDFVVDGSRAQHVWQNKQLEEEEKGLPRLKRRRSRKKRISKKQRVRRQKRQQQQPEVALVKVISEMKVTQDQQPEIAVMDVTSEKKETQNQQSEVTLVEVTTVMKETKQQEPDVILVDATSEMKETQQQPEVALLIKNIEEKQKQLQQQWEQMQRYMHQVLSPQVQQLQQRTQQQQLALVECNLEEQKHQQHQHQHQQLKQWQQGQQQQLERQPQPEQPKQVQQHQYLEKKRKRKQYQPEVAMVEVNIEDFWANERNRKRERTKSNQF